MSKPLVSVIVTHHLNENQNYLDLCLEGVLKQQDVSFEVICLSSAIEEPNAPQGITLIHDVSLDSATKKVSFAQNLLSPHSEFIMLLSDDVVLNPYCLKELTHIATQMPGIYNPSSNADIPGRFVREFKLESNQQIKYVPSVCDLKELAGFESAIFNDEPTEPIFLRMQYVPFCSTLIPKKVWDQVGGLDENLDLRGNDVDYCLRALQLGFGSFIALGVRSIHFGSKTLHKVKSDSDDAKANEYFLSKWGFNL